MMIMRSVERAEFRTARESVDLEISSRLAEISR
jgi:hypothetical protein